MGGDSIVTVLTQSVAILATFALTPIQLHKMGTSAYGLVSVGAALAAYFVFVDLGGGWAVMRFLPLYRAKGNERRAERIVCAALTLSTVSGCLVTLVLWILAPWIARDVLSAPRPLIHDAERVVRISAIWMPTVLIVGVLNGIGRALGKFRFAAVTSSFTFIGVNIAWALLAGSRNSPPKIMAAQVAIYLALILVWLIVLLRDRLHPRLFAGFGRSEIGELLGFTLPLTGSQLGVGLSMSADRILVSNALGTASLPYYSIPASLAQKLITPAWAVANVVLPRFSSTHGAGVSDRETLGRVRSTVAAVTIYGTAVIFWGGHSLLSVWLGPGFAQQSGPSIQILAIAYGVLAVSAADQTHLEAIGHIRYTTLTVLIGGTVALTLCGVFSHIWGITGAAVGIAAGFTLLSSLTFKRSFAITGERGVSVIFSSAGALAAQILFGLTTVLVVPKIITSPLAKNISTLLCLTLGGALITWFTSTDIRSFFRPRTTPGKFLDKVHRRRLDRKIISP